LQSEHTITFETILTDTVRVTDVSWDDAYGVLEQDARFATCTALDRADKQRLFDGHIDRLNGRKSKAFAEMVDAQLDIGLATPWAEVRFSPSVLLLLLLLLLLSFFFFCFCFCFFFFFFCVFCYSVRQCDPPRACNLECDDRSASLRSDHDGACVASLASCCAAV